MKSVAVCLVFVVLVVALVQGQGVPTKNCPKGEHSVLYSCQKAEPDCANPTVHERATPGGCGIPDCFCNTPTVRDLSTGKCINYEDCPTQNNLCLN